MSAKNYKSQRNLFCCWYVLLGSVEEAALKAGFSSEDALAEGIACLKSKDCQRKIREVRNIVSDGESVISGLKRLAFGKCSDAVKLAFSEELPPPHILERLDLFNVSEIKRAKGGVVEIRFSDRLKALEKLYELENAFSDSDKAKGLIDALTSSAEDENGD